PTSRRAEPLVSHNTAGITEGGVAPRDSVLGDPLASAGRKNPCNLPGRPRPPTARELDRAHQGLAEVRLHLYLLSCQHGSVADTTLARHARHATWPERRRPCHW